MVNHKYTYEASLEEADYPMKDIQCKAIMIRRDRDPSLVYKVQNYSEVQNSSKLRYDGEVVVAIYPRTKYLVERAWRLGWINITEDIRARENYWQAKPEVVEAPAIEEAPEAPVKADEPEFDAKAYLKGMNASRMRTALNLGEVDQHLADLMVQEKRGDNRKSIVAAITKRMNQIK